MSEQFEAVASHLVDVIKIIKMGRRSGLLTARRGEGVTFEEGNVIFAHGQVAEARVGRRNGVDALNWLSTWGSCRYIFLPTSGDAGKLSPSSHPGKGISTSPLPPQTSPLPPVSEILASERREGVPYATLPGVEGLRRIDVMGLSRLHRRLFLLVDGHRSMAEFIPLVGKSATEVGEILRDLERIGVVRRG